MLRNASVFTKLSSYDREGGYGLCCTPADQDEGSSVNYILDSLKNHKMLLLSPFCMDEVSPNLIMNLLWVGKLV